jgi:aryl-alcohol dehydrogenase-like predicted oxidoreductase
VELRPLGASGIRVARIGLGGYELGGLAPDVPSARAAIDAALESGTNWVDTAEGYHDTANETAIGDAIRDLPERPLISSKANPEEAPSVASDCTRHPAPASSGWESIISTSISSTGRTSPTVCRSRRRGARWASWSTRGWFGRSASQTSRSTRSRLATHRGLSTFVQDGLLLIDHLGNRETFAWCAENDIAVMVYEPLASGLLGGGPVTAERLRRTWVDLEEWSFYDRLCAPGKLERSAAVAGGLARVAARLQVPPAQVAVAWVLAQHAVSSAICGSRNPAHVRENSAVAELRLDSETIAELEALVPLGPAFA